MGDDGFIRPMQVDDEGVGGFGGGVGGAVDGLSRDELELLVLELDLDDLDKSSAPMSSLRSSSISPSASGSGSKSGSVSLSPSLVAVVGEHASSADLPAGEGAGVDVWELSFNVAESLSLLVSLVTT